MAARALAAALVAVCLSPATSSAQSLSDLKALTGVYLVLEYTYTGQTASLTYYNDVLGRRVPGRDVTVTLDGVDAVVEAKFDLKQATIERDKDYPDIITVTLPKPH